MYSGFYGCRLLSDSLPLFATVTKIYGFGFGACDNFCSITAPNLTEVGDCVFENCTNLRGFVAEKLTTIVPSSFANTNLKAMIATPYTRPSSIPQIASGQVCYAPKLAGVASLYDCASLQVVVLPMTVTFCHPRRCPNLKAVYAPSFNDSGYTAGMFSGSECTLERLFISSRHSASMNSISTDWPNLVEFGLCVGPTETIEDVATAINNFCNSLATLCQGGKLARMTIDIGNYINGKLTAAKDAATSIVGPEAVSLATPWKELSVNHSLWQGLSKRTIDASCALTGYTSFGTIEFSSVVQITQAGMNYSGDTTRINSWSAVLFPNPGVNSLYDCIS
jgi:hypothetical protein